jgi:peptidoglycan/xylan/chitin deacetylase (PgdA/CDA1 family)
MGRPLLVLGWHNVEPTWCFPAADGAGRRGLWRQLAFLARFANVVPLDEGLQALRAGRPLPPRAVAITFDDGYRDQLDVAVPMLERLRLPATFFLVPGLLDGDDRPWWEVLGWVFARATRQVVAWEGRTLGLRDDAERRACLVTVGELLKRRDRAAREQAVQELIDRCRPAGSPGDRARFLDWAGADELARRGFTTGSHSQHHAILSQESETEQRHDLAGSRKRLEQELDVPVDLLAYPNGTLLDYDDATMEAARAAGYAYAVTTVTGWNQPVTPRLELRRFVMQPERGTAGLSMVPLDPLWRRVRPLRDRGR